MEQTRAGPQLHVDGPRCPFCREPLRAEEEKVGCAGCMGWQHAACAAENRGRCAACSEELPRAPETGPGDRQPDGALQRVERRRARSDAADASTRSLEVPVATALSLAAIAGVLFALSLEGAWPLLVVLGLGALIVVGFASMHAHRRRRRRAAPAGRPPGKSTPAAPDKIPPASGEPS